jgi:hypothetical protein
VKTIDEANRYLEEDYLVWWERELTAEPASADNAHRPLEKSHNLAASLSHVETRQVRNDYTFRWKGSLYQVERGSVVSGMRGAAVRIEQRLDGSMAVRYGDRYVKAELCPVPAKAATAASVRPVKRSRTGSGKPGAEWGRNFDLHKAPKLWQAAKAAGHRRGASA